MWQKPIDERKLPCRTSQAKIKFIDSSNWVAIRCLFFLWIVRRITFISISPQTGKEREHETSWLNYLKAIELFPFCKIMHLNFKESEATLLHYMVILAHIISFPCMHSSKEGQMQVDISLLVVQIKANLVVLLFFWFGCQNMKKFGLGPKKIITSVTIYIYIYIYWYQIYINRNDEYSFVIKSGYLVPVYCEILRWRCSMYRMRIGIMMDGYPSQRVWIFLDKYVSQNTLYFLICIKYPYISINPACYIQAVKLSLFRLFAHI